MATSLKTRSTTTPCHASRLRSNFTAVPNWRWKNAPPLPPSTLQQEAPVSNTIHDVEVSILHDATLSVGKQLLMLRKTMVPSPAGSSSPLRTLQFFETMETTVKQKYHIPKNWVLSNRASECQISLSLTHTHTHARAHLHTRTHVRARTHTHTHTELLTAWSIME